MSELDKDIVKAYLIGMHDAADYATSLQLAQAFITQFKEKYPTAVNSFKDDLSFSRPLKNPGSSSQICKNYKINKAQLCRATALNKNYHSLFTEKVVLN